MLPLLKPVIALIFVVRLADAFRIFDVVYVLTGGGPANATDVMSTYIYRQMFTALDFPGGAAASVLLVLALRRRPLCRGTAAQGPAPGAMMKAGDPASRQLADAGIYGFLGLVCMLILVPIYWIVATSFKPTSEILVTPTSFYHAPDPRALPHRAERGFPALPCQQRDRCDIGSTALGFLLSVPAAWGF